MSLQHHQLVMFSQWATFELYFLVRPLPLLPIFKPMHLKFVAIERAIAWVLAFA
jgi:hypothetical protein